MPNPFEHLSPRTVEQLTRAIENESRQTATERNRALQEAIERKRKQILFEPKPPNSVNTEYWDNYFKRLSVNVGSPPPDRSLEIRLTKMIWLLMQRLGVTTLDHVNLDQVPSDYQVVVRSKGPEFPCINEIEVRGTGVANNVEQPKPSEPPKEEGPIKYY